jgi:hypothetical protein
MIAGMPWAAFPTDGRDADLQPVADALDPVLVPLGFMAGQCGASADAGQVIFCRGDSSRSEFADDGCIDLVVDMVANADGVWRVDGVRYWGFPSDRWRLDVGPSSVLAEQLAHLARTLPAQLDDPIDARRP